MGWFEEQIKLRKQNDQDVFEESIFRMASAVLGQKGAGKLNDFRLETKEAVDEILKYYRFKPTEVPEVIKDAEEQMNYALRPHGIMRREVDLDEGWQKDAFGPMIVYWKENGIPQAVFPKLLSGYYYKDGDRTVTITSKVAEQFERRALCFYRPLPQKSIGIPDLTAWLWSCISASDVVMFVGLTLAVVIVGMIIPQISKLLTGMVLESGNMTFLWGTALFIFSVAVTSQLFQTARELMMDRLVTKTDLAVESAVMMRV
ncbi:MAG: NHLP family bacteriocin export ABC transporter permease/ATPase subunit, partial [Lachnospiraceae bacterium]|nr:NHLP family bacteriocin export ABC transporter permease/ATPase subunit [Lachnospiraceae bacterium]